MVKIIILLFLVAGTFYNFLKQKDKTDLFFSFFLITIAISLTKYRYLLYTNLGLILSFTSIVLGIYSIMKTIKYFFNRLRNKMG